MIISLIVVMFGLLKRVVTVGGIAALRIIRAVTRDNPIFELSGSNKDPIGNISEFVYYQSGEGLKA